MASSEANPLSFAAMIRMCDKMSGDQMIEFVNHMVTRVPDSHKFKWDDNLECRPDWGYYREASFVCAQCTNEVWFDPSFCNSCCKMICDNCAILIGYGHNRRMSCYDCIMSCKTSICNCKCNCDENTQCFHHYMYTKCESCNVILCGCIQHIDWTCLRCFQEKNKK